MEEIKKETAQNEQLNIEDVKFLIKLRKLFEEVNEGD